MTKIASKLVLITGGASGIGKIMGREVLKHGGKLVIWDLNKLNLQQTLNEFEEFGEVYGYTIDITNTAWVKEMAKQVENEIGVVDILINNAGIVYGGYFHENSSDNIRKTMNVMPLPQCNLL